VVIPARGNKLQMKIEIKAFADGMELVLVNGGHCGRCVAVAMVPPCDLDLCKICPADKHFEYLTAEKTNK